MNISAQRCASTAPSSIGIREVADRVGNELADLAAAIHKLQVLISPLLKEAALRNPTHLQELQDIDHIYQKVGNLSEFLAALALILPQQWVLNPSTASRVITLSALASRLGLTAEEAEAQGHPAGDCDFF